VFRSQWMVRGGGEAMGSCLLNGARIKIKFDGVKMDLREFGLGGAWSAFTWLRIGTAGGLL
jgi:hypothetical protein